MNEHAAVKSEPFRPYSCGFLSERRVWNLLVTVGEEVKPL